jgi:hypothetical protein
MLVLGLCLLPLAIGFLCWLLFALAAYALPFYVAVSVGLAAAHLGLGFVPCVGGGLAAGIATLVIGQLAFATLPWPLRGGVAVAFALPAAIAGYHSAVGLAQITGFDAFSANILGCVGAVLVGSSALARLASSPAVSRDAERSVGRTVWVVL